MSLARAFALFTGSSVIGSLTQVVKGKLTAVFLGAAGVGVLNQLTSAWSLFSVIAGLGFYNGMVRHMAQSWSQDDTTSFRHQMSSAATMLLGSSLVVSFAGCLFSDRVSIWLFDDAGKRADLVCLILVSIPVFTMSQVYRAILNATRSVTALVRARIAADVSSVVVLAALLYPFGIRGAVLGYIGLHVLFLGFTIHFVHRALGPGLLAPRLSEFSWTEVRRNLGYGLNGVIAVAVGIVTSIIVSRWIISSLDESQNGIYSMALKVATVYLGGLSAAAGGYYFPTLAASKSDQEMHTHVDQTISLYFFLIPPIIVVLMAGGDVLMHILFTKEFVPAALLLLVMLPGDLFRIIAETLGLPLLVRKRLLASTGLYAAWAAMYIGLSAWLLPQYGVRGVAAAYLLSQAINAGLLLIATRALLAYRPSRACTLALARGFALVAAVAAFLWFEDSRWIGYLFSFIATGIWAVLSFQDARFATLLQRGLAMIRR